MLQKSAGLFQLTSELDFGTAFGVKSLYLKSRSSNVAAAGIMRLANTDSINFRNSGNTADIALAAGSSDNVMSYAGIDQLNLSTAQTLTNKTLSTGCVVPDSVLGTSYVKADGSRPLTANWSAGAFSATFNGVAVGSSANTITGLAAVATATAVGPSFNAVSNSTSIGSAAFPMQLVNTDSTVNNIVGITFADNASNFANAIIATTLSDHTNHYGSISLYTRGAGGLLAGLTIDTSQNATFAGTATVNSVVVGSAAHTISGLSTIINSGTLTLPTSSDTLVGRATTDTLTNKTLTAPTINGGTHTAITSLGVRDTSAAFDVTIAATSSSTLTAGRTLTVDTANTSSTLKLAANLTVSGASTINGTFSGTSSGTNTGDQTITLTGDVTGSGTGSFATTMASSISGAKTFSTSITSPAHISSTANAASAGAFRLANADAINFRNSGNSADISLTPGSTNNFLSYAGIDLANISTAQTLTNKTIDGGSNTLTNLPAANLSGSTLASGVTASSLTSVGTLTDLTVNSSNGIVAKQSGSGTSFTNFVNVVNAVNSSGTVNTWAAYNFYSTNSTSSAAAIACQSLDTTNHYGLIAIGTRGPGGYKVGLVVDQRQSVIAGLSAPATNATDGFLYIPVCAGTPTGTPTANSGYVPMVFDSTNTKFWIWNGSAWKGVVLA